MKFVVSRAQGRAYDQAAIESCRVPGLLLMENAGRGAADVISRLLPRPTSRVVVVCGTGNNGGDGFVAARHLFCQGIAVRVVLLGTGDRVAGDARIHRDAYLGVGGSYGEIAGESDELDHLADDADLVVDALFGTGLRRNLEGPAARAMAALNEAPVYRVALDLPSGLDAETGVVRGLAFRAHATVMFGPWKTGLLTPSGARHAGRVYPVGLGVPDPLVFPTGHTARLLDRPAVGAWLTPRLVGTYKHRQGSVVVVAGSTGKTGAALLTADACLRAGAGLCTVATWQENALALEARAAREVMVASLDRTCLHESLTAALAGHRVVAVGPGLGLDADARTVVEQVVRDHEGVSVLDADALTHFAGRASLLADARGRLILTPHAGELGRLLGITSADVESDRYGVVRQAAEQTRAVVVLKGAHSLIAFGDEILVNDSVNPALATAGAGDVLTGIIAALACTIAPEQAAAAGVYVHGQAAEGWRADHKGADGGLLAGELTGYLPAVLAGLK